MRSPVSVLAMSLATAAALTLSACGSGSESGNAAGAASGEPVANVAAPAGQRWSQMVRATEAGFVMGNPDAPLKLVEYASPTCGHCAQFSTESSEQLKGEMIDSGRVSLEVRPFMLNATDVILATLVSCAGPERFFPLLENLYSSHNELIAGAQGATEEAAQAAMSRPAGERLAALGSVQGIDRFMAARGIAPADYNRCLADPEAPERWARLTQQHTTEAEIAGTPTFFLNGTLLEGNTWTAIREALQAAGAR